MPTPHTPQRRLYFRMRELARGMRKKETPAEKLFWLRARKRQIFGLKFLRQYIIKCPQEPGFTKYYIADFYCDEFRLVIEIDGKIHDAQVEQDLVRTVQLNKWGYKVLRFNNEDVLNNWTVVESRIAEVTHPPTPVP